MNHWRYLLTLDYDFGKLTRYVEPCESNLSTYSLEMAKILMTATQEVDVLLKLICKEFESGDVKNECGYRTAFCKAKPKISTVKILLPEYGLDSVPFASWQENETPKWWTANNKIKHQRDIKFQEANLKNVIDAIAGLYVANLYFSSDEPTESQQSPEPIHFIPDLTVAGTLIPVTQVFKLPE